MSEIQCHCCPGSKRLSEIKEELSRVRLEDKQMSAQSKAMYWQARCRELEAMVERMERTLISIALNSCCKPCREAGLLAKQTLSECDAMKGGK